MSEFRGRGSRSRGTRGRGGPFRGGPRRGGYSTDRDGSRGGFSRGRGDGFSRGRGGPPRHLNRDESPPRKGPLLSRGYDSERGRGPPIDRRLDRYEDGYDRGIPSRTRDLYDSPPRDSGRLMDSSYRDSYGSSLREMRDDRRESFTRPSPREYPSQRFSLEYPERSRDTRESPREYGSSREFREPLNGRAEFRDREYSSRMISRQEIRVTSRGPPPREYGGRGGPPRGGLRGGRDERGSYRGSRGGYMNGIT
ncbi:unnamed protein product [Candidula unifasciata]|uniref:Uncharacterized protein n=1 Tax=Candidula unifasciata TaxID=100452 RepID=A0A8S4A6M7_9EUPU|nr:unnamed protein product [Candidula unifasciata]